MTVRSLCLKVWNINASHKVFLVFLLCAAFLIYLPSELGASLAIPPDSSEYSICLANLFEHGRFGFTLNGEWYPSRYAPWFSLTCLTPAYFLSGGNVLCMHWAILAFALMSLIAVWRIGVLGGLGKFSIFPPILLMVMPDFLFYSRVAMTEIPYTALFAMLALAFVRFANKTRHSMLACFCIGLLIAWTGLVRSTGYSLVVPFAAVILCDRVGWRRKVALIMSMSIPLAMALFAVLAYNWIVFGSPLRSGYNYWMPVPCDFPDLVFNWKYVFIAIPFLLRQPIIQISLVFIGVSLAFVLCAVYKKTIGDHRDYVISVLFVFVHAIFLLLLYLGYYWTDTRFFFPVTVCSIPLFFIALRILLSRLGWISRASLMFVIFTLCIATIINAPTRYLYMMLGRPVWLAAAQISSNVLPSNSIVIQQGDPNVLDYFGFRRKGLFLFPIKRAFDYVTHMTAPMPITHCARPPESWSQAILPELVASGICKMPFPNVLEESPDMLRDYISDGKRIFVLQGHFYSKKYFEDFKSQIGRMGLSLKMFGAWSVPQISPNPVRHLYDNMIFRDVAMDGRPELTAVYYEIVKTEGKVR